MEPPMKGRLEFVKWTQRFRKQRRTLAAIEGTAASNPPRSGELFFFSSRRCKTWIPASAGMTAKGWASAE